MKTQIIFINENDKIAENKCQNWLASKFHNFAQCNQIILPFVSIK
jgi:hypothetical protein